MFDFECHVEPYLTGEGVFKSKQSSAKSFVISFSALEAGKGHLYGINLCFMLAYAMFLGIWSGC